MTKHVLILPAMLAGALTLTGCGTAQPGALANVGTALLQNALTGDGADTSSSTSSAGESGSLLSNLLGGLLGASSALDQSSLIGTWSYTGADCVFESENLLAKAGGAIASQKLESEVNSTLAKVGIKEGSCSFTFNKDNTYSATLGGHTISGTYTLNTKDKTVTLTYLAGLAQTTAYVTKSGNTLSLLIDSDKLLTVLKGMSALSNSSSVKLAASLLSNYDGLYVGMKLKK